MQAWDRNHHRFVELDDPRVFGVEPAEDLGEFDDDENAAFGLVTALLVGGFAWGSLALALFVPWSRWPLAVSWSLIVFAGVVVALHVYVVEPWRESHADSSLVDRLNRWGL